jgi:transcriptional regulator with XRE-family HTH domain
MKTITQISKTTGLSKSYVSELASGAKGNPTNKTVELLAKALGIKPVWTNVLNKLNKISTVWENK